MYLGDETQSSHEGRILTRVRRFWDSLAGRLLALTAAVVITGELLIFVPALAEFHEGWLRERFSLAQIAALAGEGEPDRQVNDQLQYELLQNAGVLRVAMQRQGERQLVIEDETAQVGALRTYDYTNANSMRRFGWAMETFFAADGRVLRVLAKPRFEAGDFIEIVLREAPLKHAMGQFSAHFVFLSMLVLMAAGGLVYGALTLAFVRPMRDLTRAIEHFRDRPEDASIAFVRSARTDEIGRAERAAADMAEQIRLSLRQRERLAALGAAVARIGHDLRNMLATAQLVTDRLSKSDDPAVRQIAPRLERAIGRASDLAATTLRYGRADEPAPVMEVVEIAWAAADAAGDALAGFPDVVCRVEVGEEVAARADPEQLHRLFVNLIRNAAQAMTGARSPIREIVVRGAAGEAWCRIEITDTGPGVPERLREELFEPFVTSDRQGGGAGLGLAIARELARAMGGDVVLMRSDGDGAVFQVTLRAA
ncbi:MAG TPA: HAMP domain-containing sensor histidine kinase [Caulobacterales bacterium]|nr:HAMP domain-containing sensor histidine kinase [Caulobacterales bacterium]